MFLRHSGASVNTWLTNTRAEPSGWLLDRHKSFRIGESAAYEVHADQKLSLLKRLLNEETGRTLIFVRTKRATERLAEKLNRQGIAGKRLHGDRSQSQRNSALTAFQHGTSRVLVATDVASRGIHVDDIAQVINYDLPAIPEDSSIEWAGQEGPELQALPSRSFQEWSVLTWQESSARCSSRCVADTLKPVLCGKNGPCQWTSPACGQSRLSPDPGWFAFRERSFSGIRFNNLKDGGQKAFQAVNFGSLVDLPPRPVLIRDTLDRFSYRIEPCPPKMILRPTCW